MALQFKDYYIKAFDHLRSSWLRILVWTAVWFFVTVGIAYWWINVAIDTYIYEKLSIPDSGFTILVAGSGILGSIAFFVFESLRLYSFFGISYRTADDPETSWIETGLSGFLHPVRALSVSVLIQIIQWLAAVVAFFVGLALLMIFWNAFLLVAFEIVFAAASIYILVGFCMSWFQMLEDDSLSGLDALKGSLEFMRGKRLMILGLLLPLGLSFVLVSAGGVAAMYKMHEPYFTEARMAMQASESLVVHEMEMREIDRVAGNALNAKDAERIRKAMSYEYFTQDVPEYDGDQQDYIHALAEYGLAREEFEARRDHREVNDAAEHYQNMPLSTKRWGLLVFLAGLVDIVLLALMNTLLLQIYHEMDSGLLEIVVKKLEGEDKSDKPKEPDLLRSNPRPEPKPISAEADPNLIENNEPIPEPEPQKRPDSIDPGFTLKF